MNRRVVDGVATDVRERSSAVTGCDRRNRVARCRGCGQVLIHNGAVAHGGVIHRFGRRSSRWHVMSCMGIGRFIRCRGRLGRRMHRVIDRRFLLRGLGRRRHVVAGMRILRRRRLLHWRGGLDRVVHGMIDFLAPGGRGAQ